MMSTLLDNKKEKKKKKEFPSLSNEAWLSLCQQRKFALPINQAERDRSPRKGQAAPGTILRCILKKDI